MQPLPARGVHYEEGGRPGHNGGSKTLRGLKARAKTLRRHSPRRPSQPASPTDAPSAPDASLATPAGRETDEARTTSQRKRSKSRRATAGEEAGSRAPVDEGMGPAGAKPANDTRSDQPYSRYATNDVDYEERYPPDPYGEELSEKARFWRVYNEEAQMADAEMVKGMDRTLDVLLVFAGLFSAVVTTFVAQSSQALASDYAQITASLMYEFLLMQRAMANGTPVGGVPVSQLSFDSRTHTNVDVWVNGLWFTSLTFSLLTALICVLAKQWIQHYNSMGAGTPRDRALLRQYRLRGFKHWNVPFIIGSLPVLLILALFLFFAGLSVYIAPLNNTIFWAIIGFSAIGFLAYALTSVLPIVIVHCAYKTPISDYILALGYFLPYVYHSMEYLVLRLYLQVRISYGRVPVLKDLRYLSRDPVSFHTPTLKRREMSDVKRNGDLLVPELLHWLAFSSSGVSATCIAAQASSAIPPGLTASYAMAISMADLACDLLRTLDVECAASKELVIKNAHLAERLGRAASLFHIDSNFKLWDDLYTCRHQITLPQLDAVLGVVLLRRWTWSSSKADLSEGALSTADISSLLPLSTLDLELHPNVWAALGFWVGSAAVSVSRMTSQLSQDRKATQAFANGLYLLVSSMWTIMDQQKTPLDDKKPLHSLSSLDNRAMTFQEYHRVRSVDEEKVSLGLRMWFKDSMDELKCYLDGPRPWTKERYDEEINILDPRPWTKERYDKETSILPAGDAPTNSKHIGPGIIVPADEPTTTSSANEPSDSMHTDEPAASSPANEPTAPSSAERPSREPGPPSSSAADQVA